MERSDCSGKKNEKKTEAKEIMSKS